MKKTIALLIFIIVMLVAFSGCNDGMPTDTASTDTTVIDAGKTETVDTDTADITKTNTVETETTTDETTECLPENLEELLNPEFSYAPFSNIKETDAPLSNDEMKTLISAVPCDKYEVYPDLHNVPLTATLYKNGEVISISGGDNRLIGMMNLYNNALYNNQYAYSQGLLDIKDIEKAKNEEFRLVLTYTPKEVQEPRLYYETVRYDTIIITNDYFYVFAHDQPGYEGEEDMYPFFAMLHAPLFNNDGWLDLFGF